MCGIVCYYGHSKGVDRVLDALDLLAYRAPDSSGIAILGEDGELAIRKAVGTGKQLRVKLKETPLPEIRSADIEVVMGHGRWAMVGAVNETNAHPLSDRSRTRVVCENGSHNATKMLNAFAEQEKWWRARGVPIDQPIHRSKNTTEVIAYEWERVSYQLAEGDIPEGADQFLGQLSQAGIDDPEEAALRLAMWRLSQGNAHACACYSKLRPDTLYITSHNKPVAIAIRELGDGQCDIMVASDINAALMLWSKEEVERTAHQITLLQLAEHDGNRDSGPVNTMIQDLLDKLTVDVIFLDHAIHQGQELFARIDLKDRGKQSWPQVSVSRFDGSPVAAVAQHVQLNPAMVGKKGFASYTESHIAEIPDIVDGIINHYAPEGMPKLESVWRDGRLLGPGLNSQHLADLYSSDFAGLRRLLLIGEGSSWRNAQAAAPLFRQLLPGITVNVYRPVQVLNLGRAIDRNGDLAIEISWSGTTDSLLKVDSWLSDLGVSRLAITGRPQSDLGRRTASSAGTLDVLTGVEVSVATVKGYQAILLVLQLLAIHLASKRSGGLMDAELAQQTNELTYLIPQHLRTVLENGDRRQRLKEVAQRCRLYNKVVVVGDSPVNIEAELKIEELAQVLARSSDFHATTLRPLIERSAFVSDDRYRILFIINATTAEAQLEADIVLRYMRELGIFSIVHTTSHEQLEIWQKYPNVEVFLSPPVSNWFQPLIDAPFFFDLAVALAYARGLSPEAIDRPRNLAKSITVTGAERRSALEARREFKNILLSDFGSDKQAENAWNSIRAKPTRKSLSATSALRSALSVISDPLPTELAHIDVDHLVLLTDAEATEIGATMAAEAWQILLDVDLTIYRRFVNDMGQFDEQTVPLQLIRAGAFLAIRDANTITLPTDLSPRQLELLAAVYIIGLAIRLARSRGKNTAVWETGLAKIPLLLAAVLDDEVLRGRIRDTLAPFVAAGYDKVQIIGGGQDYVSAASMARSLRDQGYLAEALYTDSAWHGPLATVGGPDADHDTLIIILATDPLFQAASLVDTQVYRTRNAHVILCVPDGNQDLTAVRAVDATAVIAVPAVPRPFVPLTNAIVGSIVAEQFSNLWEGKSYD